MLSQWYNRSDSPGLLLPLFRRTRPGSVQRREMFSLYKWIYQYHNRLQSGTFVSNIASTYCIYGGWLGRAMMLGSFQCRGVLLLLHMLGQGSALLEPGAGLVVYLFIFNLVYFLISSILSSFSNASSVGRRLDILKYCGRYNPAVVVSYYRRRTR